MPYFLYCWLDRFVCKLLHQIYHNSVVRQKNDIGKSWYMYVLLLTSVFTHSKFGARLFQQCLHKYLTTNLGHMGWADLEPKQSIDLISKFDRKQNRSYNNCVLSYHWIFCIMNRCGTDKKPHKLTSVCQSSWNFGGLCLAWLVSNAIWSWSNNWIR